ncbi:creatininase family protein [Martelella alba]|uniref:Creatininase family protein n=1 Tax=Martelella alba TaxID=2590451 RepID=A0A506UD65_9HYPH|nr:creatininase family protein [Martelella alba]TPW32382.1 creatininase family protein [Martelella alba]
MSGFLEASKASWPEIEAAVAEGALAIVAVGACEQHGPHLPLVTDTVMAEGVAREIARRESAVLLPPVTYGEAWNNEAFPGTISLSPETLQAMIFDIGAGVKRIGFSALITVNGHFGNREPIALAARRLRNSNGLPVLSLDYPGLDALCADILDGKPAGFGFMHADEMETSFMLALAPDSVRMDRAEAEYPDFPPTFGMEPMQLRDFNSSGVFGDPRPATAEKGRSLIDGVVTESLRQIGLFRTRHGI